MPDDFPHIEFDENGVCNYCHAWDKRWKNFDYEKAEEQLRAIFSKARSKNRQYDCLIPYSGGRDSSYVLYLIKTKYKLNPLVVTYNNLFMSEYALTNISKTVQKLNVDHLFVTYKPEIVRKFYTGMVKRGGEFCSVCTAGIVYVIVTYQRLFKIPLVVFGTSTRVDEQSPFEVTSTHPAYMRKALLECGFSLSDIDAYLIKRHYEITPFEKVKMKLFDTDYLEVNLPDYVQWNNQEIQDALEKELEWETPDKHQDHIDCKFAPVKYYLKNKQIPHYIFKQEKYSQLIRDGQMTREEAIESLNALIEREDADVPEMLDDFIGCLGLESRDVENPEKRSHNDCITRDDLVPEEGVILKALRVPWKMLKAMKMK